jgi:hypothetical protein
MSAYLLTTDYTAWGLTASATTDTLVMKASDLIDAYCLRRDYTGATVGLGVNTFVERIQLPEDRNIGRLSYLPFIGWDTTDPNNATGIKGRYGYGRRGDAAINMYEETSLLQLSSIFGGPPAFTAIASAQVDVFAVTGECWFPAGMYMAHYTEVESRYKAGFAVIPDAIKLACVQIVQSLQNRVEGVKSLKAGDRTMQFFGNYAMADDVKATLSSYRARTLA